jgi:hypothetical protein
MNNLILGEQEKQKQIFKKNFLNWNRNRAIPLFATSQIEHFSEHFYNILSKYQPNFLSEEEKNDLLYEELIKEHKQCFLYDKNAFQKTSNDLCMLYQKSLEDYHQTTIRKKVNRTPEIKALKLKIRGLEELVITLQNKMVNGEQNESTRNP